MIDPKKFSWFRIEPIDAWFFRDGRPSNRGEDQSDLESEFPPNAATIVGAIRAALARERGWNGDRRTPWNDALKPVLGDGFDNLGSLSFLGPLLMKGRELLYPMPRHVVGHRVDGRFCPITLLVPSREPVATDCGDIRLPTLPEDWRDLLGKHSDLSDDQRRKPPEPASNLFVTNTGMTKILNGQAPSAEDCRERKELFAHEGRIGIRRDDLTRTTGQGDMYSPRYVRLMPEVALVMAVSGVPSDWKMPSLMPLGGESRMAGVEQLAMAPTLPETERSSGTATVVSVTPSHFTGSWFGAGPGELASQLTPELSGRIVAVALDRPQRIGGWDFTHGPQSLLPFVAAGTVWWIENVLAGNGLIQIGDALHTSYGHGLTFAGGSA